MKLSVINLFCGLMLATLAVIAVGCMPMKSDHPYQPSPDEAIPVPPGAQILAFGHYPVAFVMPREQGNLYVWDEDAHKTAYMSSTVADSPSQTVDLNQLSKNSFDPTHSYRIYFLPTSAVTITTQPATGK
jgi:hypothetical protein